MSGMFQGTFNHDSATDSAVNGNFTITGNLVVSGTINTGGTGDGEIVDAVQWLNFGEAGAGVTGGISGIIIDRGPATTNYEMKFLESTQTLQIGFAGSLANVQRGGDMTANYVPFGHSSGGRLTESANLTFDDSTLALTGNMTVSGTVDGVDVGALSTAYTAHLSADSHTNYALADGTRSFSGLVTMASGAYVSSGNLGVGVTAGSALGLAHIQSASSGASSVNASGNELVIENSAGSGMTILSGNTSIGHLFFGDDGVSDGAYEGQIGYNHSTDSLFLATTNNTAITIDSSQNVLPGTTQTQDFGSASLEWDNGYFVGVTQSSDRRLKNSITPISNATKFLTHLRPVNFKMNNVEIPEIKDKKDKKGKITEKGRKAFTVTHGRPHTGFLAQEVKEAMTASGMDDWAGYVYNKEVDKHMLRHNEFVGVLVAGFKEIESRTTTAEDNAYTLGENLDSVDTDLKKFKSDSEDRLDSLESKTLKNGVSLGSKDGKLTLCTSGSESVTIDEAGHVGFGTSVPSCEVDVKGTIQADTIKIGGKDILEIIAEMIK